MKATAELQVVPLGTGTSVREQIQRVVDLLEEYDFTLETHANGTNIEGDMADILAAVGHVHVALHRDGNARLISYLKLESRTDKLPTLEGKKL